MVSFFDPQSALQLVLLIARLFWRNISCTKFRSVSKLFCLSKPALMVYVAVETHRLYRQNFRVGPREAAELAERFSVVRQSLPSRWFYNGPAQWGRGPAFCFSFICRACIYCWLPSLRGSIFPFSLLRRSFSSCCCLYVLDGYMAIRPLIETFLRWTSILNFDSIIFSAGRRGPNLQGLP